MPSLTPRHYEALGLGAIAAGITALWGWPALLISGGMMLVAVSLLRTQGGNE